MLGAQQLDATLTDRLLQDDNGDGKLGPGEVLEYSVTITNNGAETLRGIVYSDVLDPNVSLLSADSTAKDDYYLLTGGKSAHTIPAQYGFIQNNDYGAELSVKSHDATTEQGFSLSVASDGSFTYTPGTYLGRDGFNYTVQDSLGNQFSARVTLFVAGSLYAANNTVSDGGVGTFGDPFNTLAEAEQESEEGDAIFLYSGDKTSKGQDRGIFVKNQQTLIGQSVAIPVFGASGYISTLPEATSALTRPVVVKTSDDANGGTAIIAGDNTSILGLRVGDLSEPIIFRKGLYAFEFGSIFLRFLSFAHSNSYPVDLRVGDVDADIDSVTNLNPAVTGASLVHLDTCSGSLMVNGKVKGVRHGISVSGSVDAYFHDVELTDAGISYAAGSGSLTIESDGGGINFTGPNTSAALRIQDAANFLLRSTDENSPFAITDAGIGQGSGGSTHYAVSISGSENIILENLDIDSGSGSSDTGVAILDSDSVTIKDTELTVHGGFTGFRVGSTNAAENMNVTLSGNTITGGSSYPDNVRTGVAVQYSSSAYKALKLNITGNTFQATRNEAIELGFLDGSGSADNRNVVTIEDNFIADPGEQGINIQNSSDSTTRFLIRNNEIDGQVSVPYASRSSSYIPRYGIIILSNDSSLSDLTISKNKINDFDRDQVRIASADSGFIRTLIEQNEFRAADELNNDDAALLIVSQSAGDSVHATVSGNIIDMPDVFSGLEFYSQGAGSLTCADIDANRGDAPGSAPDGKIRLINSSTGNLQVAELSTVSARNNGVELSTSGTLSSVSSCQSVQ